MCQRTANDETQAENSARNFRGSIWKCNSDFNAPYYFRQVTRFQILHTKLKSCFPLSFIKKETRIKLSYQNKQQIIKKSSRISGTGCTVYEYTEKQGTLYTFKG